LSQCSFYLQKLFLEWENQAPMQQTINSTMKPKQKIDIDPLLAEELAEAKEQIKAFFERFGDIYFWPLGRKARAISASAMITNFLVSINAGFIMMVQPQSLSLNFEVVQWTFYFTSLCSVYYFVMLLFSQISLSQSVAEKAILYWVLASLVMTLSIFSSLIGFFDSLTWFIFFLYTTLGLILLDWRQVVLTDTLIIFSMIAISVFHESFPYPVQVYLFAQHDTLATMSFLDLLSAWSITASAAFGGMWIMVFLLRNWHVHSMEHVSQAHLDPLTQVMKRSELLDALEDEVLQAVREKNPLTVAIIDLDKFKSLNAEYGHVFGDRMLVHFAKHLKEITRREDLVGRYGGQEFIVVFPRCRTDIAEQVLERLRLKLALSAIQDNKQTSVTVKFSAGISFLRPGDQKFENVIARADRALGQVKALGGNKTLVDASSLSPSAPCKDQ